jgi:DNA-binding SARP family transcriptional activator
MQSSADRVFLLGSFRLSWQRRNVALPVGSQRVVAYLAMAEDLVPRRSVIAALWPDLAGDRAAATLRTSLWRIGRIVPSLVRRDSQWLWLDPAVSVDARELELAVRSALHEPASTGAAELSTLTHADDLLADWDAEWVVAQRERLRQLRLEALERLAEDLTDRGLVGQAVEAGLAAVADDPYRESAHRVLIEAYLRNGNVAAAVDQLRRLRQTLRSELGVVPSDELVARVGRTRRPQRREK